MKALTLAKHPGWPLRLIELALVIAICALTAYWALILMSGPPQSALPVAETIPATSSPGNRDDLLDSAHLFGSRRPGTLSDNIQALGIIADRGGRGTAILSIDGQPPRNYRVGDSIDGRTVTAIRSGEVELEVSGTRRVYKVPERENRGAGIVRH